MNTVHRHGRKHNATSCLSKVDRLSEQPFDNVIVLPSLKQLPKIHQASTNPSRLRRPLFTDRVSAGFPSPADDYIECKLDLNEFLVQHPSATFYVRVSGDSMCDAGIFDGDYLIVDRSLEPTHGKIVLAVVNGEMTVKRLFKKNNILELRPENKAYKPLRIKNGMELSIYGVVSGVFRKTL